MQWALYDAVDKCWLGTNATGTGPKIFSEGDVINGLRVGESAKLFARVSAEIAARRLHWPFERIQVVEWHDVALVPKDELPLEGTTLDILKRIERGVI